MMFSPAARPAAVAFSLFVAAPFTLPLTAQCAQFAPGGSLPGVSGSVMAFRKWDPDGAGPLPQVTIVAGGFTVANNVAAASIAAWDPTTGTWSALGSGVDGAVYALEVLATGELVAAGVFTTAGGVTANGIARWNGSTWSAFGTGVASEFPPAMVNALAVLGNGDLVAAGDFDSAGGVPTRRIARWNGSTWSAVALGANGPIQALLTLSNGDLLAGGVFGTIGTVAANYIARFDGTSWSPLGAGVNSTVYSLHQGSNGDVYAGGSFTAAGGTAANRIARWNGTSWSAVGNGLSPTSGTVVYDIAEAPNGDLLVGGTFTSAGGTPTNDLARWDGTNWSAIGSTFTGTFTHPWSHGVRSIEAQPNGDLLVGGWFSAAGTTTATGIARWNGAQWLAVASGTNASVTCFAQKPNGNVIAGGTFAQIGGTDALRIAEWNGAQWSALGGGIDGEVLAVAALPNGDVVAGGRFSSAGSGAVEALAKWDGTTWTTLGSGLGNGASAPYVTALLALPNGDLIAAGRFSSAGGIPVVNIARWDGTTWSPLGSGLWGTFDAMVRLANGDIVVGGAVIGFNTGVVRWDGTTWSKVGSTTVGAVTSLTTLPNGDLVAGGPFTTPGNRVIRWNGSTWSALGAGVDAAVMSVATMPDGDVVVGGGFLTAGGQPATRIARWNGSTWSPIGTGANLPIDAMLVDAHGTLFLGGAFTVVDGVAAPNVARYVSTCVATSTNNGNGCNGQQLVAVSPPWVDATLHTRATGLPNLAIALAVTSFASIPQGVAPLSSFFGSTSPAGCDLLVGPDIVQAIASTNGIADSQLFLPNTPPLVGVAFFQQMIPVELDPALSILAITATNSLRLVAGDF